MISKLPCGELDEFDELACAQCDDALTNEQVVQLEELVTKNPELRRYYILYLQMHALMERGRGIRDDGMAFQDSTPEGESHSQGPTVASSVVTDLRLSPAVDAPMPAAFPSFVYSYYSSGWPVAYLIATVILGIGALIGASTSVLQPLQVVHQPGIPNFQSPIPNPSSAVGQVTGMVDCQWSEPDTKAVNGAHVPLGRRYALSAGLLEITYDTGAKVLLQGPVTYEVESPFGGYLSVGKLTARLEQRSEVRGQRSDSANQESEIINHKSFAVRTPTALVTDLGTEFGVEVDKAGSTTSHVFRGTINVHPVHGERNAQADDIVLRANESARTERESGDSRRVIVRRVVVKSDDFVRRLQESAAPSVDVLAWFRMGEDEPNARAGEPAGTEIHSHNKTRVRLERHGSPTYNADTEAPGSSLSMTFHAGIGGEYFSSPRFAFVPNDYFILETWVKLHKLGPEKQVIVISGQGPQNGYCLTVENGRWNGVFGGVAWIDSGVACEIDKWTHLALVCERGKAQLWINGRPEGRVLDAIPNMPDGPFAIGGQIGYPERTFNGEIDELRLSTFMAPFRPEMLLLRKADRSQ